MVLDLILIVGFNWIFDQEASNCATCVITFHWEEKKEQVRCGEFDCLYKCKTHMIAPLLP